MNKRVWTWVCEGCGTEVTLPVTQLPKDCDCGAVLWKKKEKDDE